VRQDRGVGVRGGVVVGTGVEVSEATGAGLVLVSVGTGGFAGEQAVRTVRSANSDASSIFA